MQLINPKKFPVNDYSSMKLMIVLQNERQTWEINTKNYEIYNKYTLPITNKKLVTCSSKGFHVEGCTFFTSH